MLKQKKLQGKFFKHTEKGKNLFKPFRVRSSSFVRSFVRERQRERQREISIDRSRVREFLSTWFFLSEREFLSTWFFPSKQTFTKKRAPYFHVHMLTLYKVFVVERKTISFFTKSS